MRLRNGRKPPIMRVFMLLHTLQPAHGARRKRKRVGRGISAGQGKTAGAGTKGQQSRTGKNRKFGFEGGQTPLLRRQPKLGGFRSPRRTGYEPLPLTILEKKLPAGTYDRRALAEHSLVRTSKPLKLLGKDVPTKAFHLTVAAASRGARAAVLKAGGTVTITKD